MNDSSAKTVANSQYAIAERWGDLSDVGFTAIPNTLIHAQSKLGLSTNQIAVLLNLLMHWWSPDAHPFPRSNSIAKRTGLGIRTVQRELLALEEANLIKKVKSGDSTQYELHGLRAALEELNRDYAWRNLSKAMEKRHLIGDVQF